MSRCPHSSRSELVKVYATYPHHSHDLSMHPRIVIVRKCSMCGYQYQTILDCPGADDRIFELAELLVSMMRG